MINKAHVDEFLNFRVRGIYPAHYIPSLQELAEHVCPEKIAEYIKLEEEYNERWTKINKWQMT